MARYTDSHSYDILCPDPDCPDPGNNVRDGWHGGKRRYKCKACGKKFNADGYGMHRQFTARQIGAAIDKYHSGMSYRQIAEFIGKYTDAPRPSKHTVHDWIKGYTIMAHNFMLGKVGADGREESATGKPIKANNGDVFMADELYVDVAGRQMYLWNIMDRDSRYILAAHLSEHRNRAAATALMEKAEAAVGKPPKKIITDGHNSYVEAIETVFPSAEHVVSQSIRHEVNNNLSERLQGTLRDRNKTQRGLESLRTGQDSIDGFVLDYKPFFASMNPWVAGHPLKLLGSPAKSRGETVGKASRRWAVRSRYVPMKSLSPYTGSRGRSRRTRRLL